MGPNQHISVKKCFGGVGWGAVKTDGTLCTNVGSDVCVCVCSEFRMAKRFVGREESTFVTGGESSSRSTEFSFLFLFKVSACDIAFVGKGCESADHEERVGGSESDIDHEVYLMFSYFLLQF